MWLANRLMTLRLNFRKRAPGHCIALLPAVLVTSVSLAQPGQRFESAGRPDPSRPFTAAGSTNAIDLLLDMAASAPSAASAAKAGADAARPPRDSREKLLRELKQSPTDTEGSGQSSANLQFDLPALVGSTTQPVTKAADENARIEQEVAVSRRSEPVPQAREPRAYGVPEDSWIRATVRYVRANRYWLAAVAVGTLLLVATVSFAFKRSAHARPKRGTGHMGDRHVHHGGGAAERGPTTPMPTPSRRRRSRRPG